MPAASTASAAPALGPNGAPAVLDTTHRAAEPTLAAIPAANSSRVGRDQARNPHASWKTAIDAKNTPEGTQSFQCMGATAKWMTAAPIDATAAHRAASRSSVFLASFAATPSTLTQHLGRGEQRVVTVESQIRNTHRITPTALEGPAAPSPLSANGQPQMGQWAL